MSYRTFILSILMIIPTLSLESVEIQVLDSRDSIPVMTANVALINPDDTLYLQTNVDGIVKIDDSYLVKGKSKIKISRIGFKPLTKVLSDKNKFSFYLQSAAIEVDDIVVTAQYQPGSSEKSLNKINVINETEIRNMAAQNVNDLLFNQMNIRLSQDNILGSGASIQGLSGNNVKILVDGVPVIGRVNGNIDLSQILTDNVKRVEIIEGPLSVQYGTDALAGTINIITKSDLRQNYNVSTNGYYESTGKFNSTTNLEYNFDGVLLSLQGGRNYFRGWGNNSTQFNFNMQQRADSGRVMQWNPKEQIFGNLSLNTNIEDFDVRYKLDVFDEEIINRGNPRGIYSPSAFDDYYFTNRFDNSFHIKGKPDDNSYINFIAAYNMFERRKNTFFVDLSSLNKNLTENTSDQDTSNFDNLNLRGSYNYASDAADLNWQLGYDLNYETAVGQRIENGRQEMGDYAIFSTIKYNLTDEFQIMPALRFTYNTNYEAPLIPSLNLKKTFNIDNSNDRIILRGSVARGFRAPELKELYFLFVDINHNVVGNRDLRAEQSVNVNFSAEWHDNSFDSKSKIVISGFNNNINDLITLAATSATQFSYVNIGNFSTHGLNMTYDYTKETLKLSLGAGITGRYNFLSEDYDVDKFQYSPEVNSTILYHLGLLKMDFSLFLKYTGELPQVTLDQNDNISNRMIEDYTMVNFTVTRKFFDGFLNLRAGVNNLLDITNINGFTAGSVHSSGSTSIPIALGRNFFFNISLNLNSNG